MTTHPANAADLLIVNEFAAQPLEVQEWLAARGHMQTLAEGEHLFDPGQPAVYLFAVLEGSLQLVLHDGERQRPVMQMDAGHITGVLPMSRMEEISGSAVALTPLRVYALDRTFFGEMDEVAPSLVQALVSVMANRIREFSLVRSDEERLAALSKLAAGLAHELNNPVAALQRAASQLHHLDSEALSLLAPAVAALPAHAFSHFTLAVGEVLHKRPNTWSALEMSEIEDGLLERLHGFGMPMAATAASQLTEAGLDETALDALTQPLPVGTEAVALSWAVAAIGRHRLSMGIQQAAARIHEIVESIKDFSNMDRSTDWHSENLNDVVHRVLNMLHPDLETKGIALHLHLDEHLPEADVVAGEINQLVYQLVDNAIFFSPIGGEVHLHTYLQGDFIRLDVANTGEPYCTRCAAPHLRSVLYHQAVGRRQRFGFKHCSAHHRGAQRQPACRCPKRLHGV